MDDISPIIFSIPLYFALIGIELLIQAIKRYRIYRLNDALTNISCGVTQQLSGIFFKVISIAAYQFVFENFAFFSIPTTWYNLIILFILADFFYYWAHRKSHEINLFWGGHVVHHQSEDYNFSVALRQGSFQIIWTFFFYFPLALMGFKTVDFLLMSSLVTVYQFWIHTETIGKLGPIEWIFNTPSHHRVHHGRNPKYIDKNHAGVFIIWDKMFGTFQEEEERPTYGITKQTASWNPVWVNLQHYAQIAKDLPKMKGIRNKLKYLFYKPGWRPHELGGTITIPEVDPKKDKKYNKQANGRLSLYILIQYILLLGATALFLFKSSEISVLNQVSTVVVIVCGITACGLLMEEKKSGVILEILRWLATPLLIYIIAGFTVSSIFFYVAVVLSFVSIVSLTFMVRNVANRKEKVTATR